MVFYFATSVIRSASRTLCVLLLLGILGHLAHLAALPIRRWCAREAMEEALLKHIPKELTVRLVFDRAAFKALAWKKEGREFRHHGRMYDVITTRTLGETIQLTCLDDEREERLLRQLEMENQENRAHTMPDPLLLMFGWHAGRVGIVPGPILVAEMGSVGDSKNIALKPREPEAPPPRTNG